MQSVQWPRQCCRILYETNHVLLFHLSYLHILEFKISNINVQGSIMASQFNKVVSVVHNITAVQIEEARTES